MDSHQHQALSTMFLNRRLLPWVPEHSVFIQAELAKLDILEPNDAASYRDFYDNLSKKHDADVQAVIADEQAQEVSRKMEQVREIQARMGVQEPQPEIPAPVVIETVPETPTEVSAPEIVPVEKKPKAKKGRPKKLSPQ